MLLSPKSVTRLLTCVLGLTRCFFINHHIAVVGGLQPDFNTTSQNIVNVDDFFLKSLQSESAGVYLYSCNGVEFRLAIFYP